VTQIFEHPHWHLAHHIVAAYGSSFLVAYISSDALANNERKIEPVKYFIPKALGILKTRALPNIIEKIPTTA
jgi:hypothetical protein